MRATEFEFHQRFWIIVSIFALSFLSYRIDPVTAAVWLVKLLGGRSIDMNSLAARHGVQAWFVVSAALVLASAWMRTWGGAYLRTEVVHDTRVHTEKLVADGPFRHVRNPLYFGNVLMAAGIGLLSSRIGWFILVLGQTLFILRLIGREEAALRETQGEAYRAYLASVPRLWPALVPRVPARGMQAKWLQAFLGEAWLWLLGLDGLLLAWTLNSRLYFRIFLGCPVAILLREIILKWRRKRQPAVGAQ
jgi:protein-S-isoprenylcysteine O-methyltransferase Ste14